MKKILITGGAGFIGSHLCNYLLKKKNYIICLDNLFSGNIDNIKKIQNNKNFKFIYKDILSPVSFSVDEIYNLACPASPIHYQFDPVKTIKSNVNGTINVLELAYKKNAKILQASTSEIYGNPLQHPQDENYWGNVNPIGLRSCYDEGKRCAETLFFDYYRQYNIKIKIARIFNTFGPNMRANDGRVISNFIVQALSNLPITIYGKGKQTRSFCYIDDLIRGLVLMMNSNKKITGPINLGNPKEQNILNVAKKIIILSKSKSKIIYKKLPEDDPERRKPNIMKAKKILNWFPKVKFDQGIRNTIKFFKNN